MINHDILADKFRKAMGGRIPYAARDSWAEFIRTQGTRFWANYDWIRDGRFYDWVHLNIDVLEIEDGTEGFAVFIYEPKSLSS